MLELAVFVLFLATLHADTFLQALTEPPENLHLLGFMTFMINFVIM